MTDLTIEQLKSLEERYRSYIVAYGCVPPNDAFSRTLVNAAPDLIAMAIRCAEAERWQQDVADGIGYLNRPEGQSGYEVASAQTIVDDWKAKDDRIATLERELAEAKRAVSDQLHYDMQALLTGTPEERAARELAAEREQSAKLRAELAETQKGTTVTVPLCSDCGAAVGMSDAGHHYCECCGPLAIAMEIEHRALLAVLRSAENKDPTEEVSRAREAVAKLEAQWGSYAEGSEANSGLRFVATRLRVALADLAVERERTARAVALADRLLALNSVRYDDPFLYGELTAQRAALSTPPEPKG